MLEELLKLPQLELPKLAAVVGGVEVEVADLTHLPTRCRFVAMIPHWDFSTSSPTAPPRGSRIPAGSTA
jgi:hypothetical protein